MNDLQTLRERLVPEVIEVTILFGAILCMMFGLGPLIASLF